jgi:Gpi18-like mannosyltransferase
VLSVYLALDKRPALSVICIAASFAFKLQAVFILPLFIVLIFSRRVRLWHLLLFPATYLVLVLPAVLAGRPLWDTVTLYFSQVGSVGSGLNYNSPSVFAFFDGISDTALAAKAGVFAAAAFTLGVMLWLYRSRSRLSDYTVLAAALLFVVAVPFLLPHMHDRYFFIADVLSLVFAVSAPEYFMMPLLCEFASLLGYHAYLKARYLLPMRYGAAALAIVIAVLFIFIGSNIRSTRAKRIK